MKRCTVAFEVQEDGNGDPWLAPSTNKLFEGKEFVNESQAVQSVADFARENPGAKLPEGIVFLTVVTF